VAVESSEGNEGRNCTVLWRSEQGKGKSDLKRGHVRAQLACD
jgi:hypothetical protein